MTLSGRLSGGRIVGASAVAVAVGVLLLSVLQTPPGRSLLVSVGLAPTADRFLELYFVDSASLPTDVRPGQIVPVAFTVVAHGSTAPVSWRMEAVTGARATPIRSGTLDVPDGEARTVTTSATVSCADLPPADPRTQIRVTAGDPPQQILFWVTCQGTGP